jgi:hypothetical protein
MLKVFENMVLRKIFGPKTDKVTGKWRRLRKQELNALHSSANVIRVIILKRLRWAGHVANMGEKGNVYRVSVRRSERKRTLSRPRRRWKNNIQMDL